MGYVTGAASQQQWVGGEGGGGFKLASTVGYTLQPMASSILKSVNNFFKKSKCFWFSP